MVTAGVIEKTRLNKNSLLQTRHHVTSQAVLRLCSRAFSLFLSIFHRPQPHALKMFVTSRILILCASTQWMDDLTAVICHCCVYLVTSGGID